jgi:hypothetical protein
MVAEMAAWAIEQHPKDAVVTAGVREADHGDGRAVRMTLCRTWPPVAPARAMGEARQGDTSIVGKPKVPRQQHDERGGQISGVELSISWLVVRLSA